MCGSLHPYSYGYAGSRVSLKMCLMHSAAASLTWLVVRIESQPEPAVPVTELKSIFEEFGGPYRLRALADLVRNQPAGAALDARIALETGWLRPYSEWRGTRGMVTGVISGDHFERYPLYAPWFAHAPREWWNDGAAICNRVPNLPRYSSDISHAMMVIPFMKASQPCSIVIRRDDLWTVEAYGEGGKELAGISSPGLESLPKALVLAAIDFRIRQAEPANRRETARS